MQFFYVVSCGYALINVHKLQRIFKALTEKLVAILLILFFNFKFKVLGLLLLLADAERFDVRVAGWDTGKSSKIYQRLLIGYEPTLIRFGSDTLKIATVSVLFHTSLALIAYFHNREWKLFLGLLWLGFT